MTQLTRAQLEHYLEQTDHDHGKGDHRACAHIRDLATTALYWQDQAALEWSRTNIIETRNRDLEAMVRSCVCGLSGLTREQADGCPDPDKHDEDWHLWCDECQRPIERPKVPAATLVCPAGHWIEAQTGGRIYGGVAQGIEQGTPKARDDGSSPSAAPHDYDAGEHGGQAMACYSCDLPPEHPVHLTSPVLEGR